MELFFDSFPKKELKREKNEKNIQKESFNLNKQNLTIPVVFHIVYNTSSQNISDQQILSQLEVINDDFNRTNFDAFNVPFDFNSIVSSIQINFCLAKRTPEGNPTTGIVRKQTNITEFALYDTTIHYTSLGGSSAWNTKEYLNIWVTNIGNSILGWAQFPGSGNNSTDGVVIDYQNFGVNGTSISPYNLGRTATHELGHYFNLYHLWGDNNCGNDWVNDTPIQQEANFGCPNHPSISCSNSGDMYMNFMDYTNDACMNSFTIGQRNRIWNSINVYRPELLTSYGCMPVIVSNSDAKIEIISPTGTIEGCNNPISIGIKIKNKSSDQLYTALIKYKINSSNYSYQWWNGNLSQNESDLISLSEIAIGGNNHLIEVELLAPNNQIDINLSDNSDNKLFQTNGGTSIDINLTTDNYGHENSWQLFDNNNDLLFSGNNLTNNTHYIYNYCLDKSCYKFVINDIEGDGFCCDYGSGSISINKSFNNLELSQLSFFNFTDTLFFCVTELAVKNVVLKNVDIYPNPSKGLINIISDIFSLDIPIIAKVFDLTGQLILHKKFTSSILDISKLNNGIYILEIEQNNNINKSKVILNKP